MTLTEALTAYLEARGLALDEHYRREALRTLAQALMECDVSRMLDAAPYERNGSRRAYRNGYRDSIWYTSVGAIPLRIPKLRRGSYYPLFLNPQTEADLLRLAQDAYVAGIDMNAVQSALNSVDLPVLQPYDMADITERLADVVYNAHNEPLHADYPALFLDLLDVEHDGRWRQWLIALGVQPSGTVDLLAHELVSLADDRAWARLLRRLRQRGLKEPEVVIGGDDAGVRAAVSDVLVDAVWQHHRNFLLRGSGEDALVRAVSDLAVRVETDQRHLPRMQWPVRADDFDFVPVALPILVMN
jgi:putative transposase